MTEHPTPYAATPDPDDTPSREPASQWTECEQGHWGYLVEMEARLRAQRLELALLRADQRDRMDAAEAAICNYQRWLSSGSPPDVARQQALGDVADGATAGEMGEIPG